MLNFLVLYCCCCRMRQCCCSCRPSPCQPKPEPPCMPCPPEPPCGCRGEVRPGPCGHPCCDCPPRPQPRGIIYREPPYRPSPCAYCRQR